MNKILCTRVFALLLICPLFGDDTGPQESDKASATQESITQDINPNSYDGLQWGSSSSLLKDKYDNLIELTRKEDSKIKESVFAVEKNDDLNKAFRYFDDKLYWGRTIYRNPSSLKLDAIINKLKNTYGQYTDYKKWTENNSEIESLIWNGFEDMVIDCQYKKEFNEFGRLNSIKIYITYVCPSIEKQKHKLLVELIEAELEL